MYRIVILISGNGSNLQAIIDDINNENRDITIAAVISSHAHAYGLQRAANANIPSYIITRDQYPQRADYDAALVKIIDSLDVDLIVLAGFMRILTADFVHHYSGKLINIHPSLLPKFPGLNTHEKALETQEKYHGCSIHFVTEELDTGPLIAQASLTIHQNDDADSLKRSVQTLEHELYPKVIRLFAEGAIELDGERVYIDETKSTTLQVNNVENL